MSGLQRLQPLSVNLPLGLKIQLSLIFKKYGFVFSMEEINIVIAK